MIATGKLTPCGIVETWHDGADCPNIIACTPRGYKYVPTVRLQSDLSALSLLTNYGGVCILYKSFFKARTSGLPLYRLLHSRCNDRCTCCRDLSTWIRVCEQCVLRRLWRRTRACFYVYIVSHNNIIGDINIHLDVNGEANTSKFNSLPESNGLVQQTTWEQWSRSADYLRAMVPFNRLPESNGLVQQTT